MKKNSKNIAEQAKNQVEKIRAAKNREEVLISLKILKTLTTHFIIKLEPDQIRVLGAIFLQQPFDNLYIAVCGMTTEIFISFFYNRFSQGEDSKSILEAAKILLDMEKFTDSLISLMSYRGHEENSLKLILKLFELSPKKAVERLLKMPKLLFIDFLNENDTSLLFKEKILHFLILASKEDVKIKNRFRESDALKSFLGHFLTPSKNPLKGVLNAQNCNFNYFATVISTFYIVFFDGFKNKKEIAEKEKLNLLFKTLKTILVRLTLSLRKRTSLFDPKVLSFLMRTLSDPARMIEWLLKDTTKTHLNAVLDAYPGGVEGTLVDFIGVVNCIETVNAIFESDERKKRLKENKTNDAEKVEEEKTNENKFTGEKGVKQQQKESENSLETNILNAKTVYLELVAIIVRLSPNAKNALVEISVLKTPRSVQKEQDQNRALKGTHRGKVTPRQSAIISFLQHSISSDAHAHLYEKALKGYFEQNFLGSKLAAMTFLAVDYRNSRDAGNFGKDVKSQAAKSSFGGLILDAFKEFYNDFCVQRTRKEGVVLKQNGELRGKNANDIEGDCPRVRESLKKSFISALRTFREILKNGVEIRKNLLGVEIAVAEPEDSLNSGGDSGMKTERGKSVLNIMGELLLMHKDEKIREPVSKFLKVWLYGSVMEEKRETEAKQSQSKLSKDLLKAFNQQKFRMKALEEEKKKLSEENVRLLVEVKVGRSRGNGKDAIETEEEVGNDMAEIKLETKEMEEIEQKPWLRKMYLENHRYRKDLNDLYTLVGIQAETIDNLKKSSNKTSIEDQQNDKKG